MLDERIKILDASHGSDLPFFFIEQRTLPRWGLSKDDSDVKTILERKHDVDYWEAWDSICSRAFNTHMVKDGCGYQLVYDGALYAVLIPSANSSGGVLCNT